jgi:hypothetical protein
VREVQGSCGAGQPAFFVLEPETDPLGSPLANASGHQGQFVWLRGNLRPLLSLCEECAMEKRRLRTTISSLERPSSQRGGHTVVSRVIFVSTTPPTGGQSVCVLPAHLTRFYQILCVSCVYVNHGFYILQVSLSVIRLYARTYILPRPRNH